MFIFTPLENSGVVAGRLFGFPRSGVPPRVFREICVFVPICPPYRISNGVHAAYCGPFTGLGFIWNEISLIERHLELSSKKLLKQGHYNMSSVLFKWKRDSSRPVQGRSWAPGKSTQDRVETGITAPCLAFRSGKNYSQNRVFFGVSVIIGSCEMTC